MSVVQVVQWSVLAQTPNNNPKLRLVSYPDQKIKTTNSAIMFAECQRKDEEKWTLREVMLGGNSMCVIRRPVNDTLFTAKSSEVEVSPRTNHHASSFTYNRHKCDDI